MNHNIYLNLRIFLINFFTLITARLKKDQQKMSTQASFDLYIHALAIISISDHFTRSRVRMGSERVFGILLGIQKGAEVEIFTIFETSTTEEGLFDLGYLESRKEAGMFLKK